MNAVTRTQNCPVRLLLRFRFDGFKLASRFRQFALAAERAVAVHMLANTLDARVHDGLTWWWRGSGSRWSLRRRCGRSWRFRRQSAKLRQSLFIRIGIDQAVVYGEHNLLELR